MSGKAARPTLVKLAFPAMFAALLSHVAWTQELAPRAYTITPVSANAITLTNIYFSGGLEFNGVVPDASATGTFSTPIVTYYHSFGFFGHSANIVGALPYGVGTFQGEVSSAAVKAYRSGLLDSGFRFAVNLKGGPAMSTREFAKWKQKVLLGASLKVIAPTGQYDPRRLINWGANRWAFKPEFGYSQRFNRWILDGSAGVWFFTTNPAFFSPFAPQPRTQSPIGSFEGHLSYDVKRFLWIAVDGNYWFGGTASVNGQSNPATKQVSSRLGATASLHINKQQAIKISYSNGVYGRFGGSYQAVSVGWQYAWLRNPK